MNSFIKQHKLRLNYYNLSKWHQTWHNLKKTKKFPFFKCIIAKKHNFLDYCRKIHWKAKEIVSNYLLVRENNRLSL